MKMVLPKINFAEVPRLMSVAYAAVLDISEDSVLFLSVLLHAERVRRGTRRQRRALGTYKQQAVLVLRWFLDDTRMSALARDNGIAVSMAYDYRDEGIAPSAPIPTGWPGSPTGSVTAHSPWRTWVTKANPGRSPFRSKAQRPGPHHRPADLQRDPRCLALPG